MRRRCNCLQGLVPRAGLEPARPREQEILSLRRLPLPPSGLRDFNDQHDSSFDLATTVASLQDLCSFWNPLIATNLY